MLVQDLMLKRDDLIELAKKQYPARPEIVRMLVLFEPRQTKDAFIAKGSAADEVIELSVPGTQKIFLAVSDGRIAGVSKG